MVARKKAPKIKSVAIYCHNKPNKEKVERAFITKLMKFLSDRGVHTINGDIRTVSMMQNKLSIIDDEKHYDLKIGIGGDGTLLKMIRSLQRNDGYLLGINFGTLGFLSELSPKNAFPAL